MLTLIFPAIAILSFLIILFTSFKTVYAWESGITFRFGKRHRVNKPGLHFIIPWVETLKKLDLRVITIDIPKQETISRDNVPLNTDAVVYFKTLKNEFPLIKVANYKYAVSQLAQSALRSVIGKSELDSILSQREKLERKIEDIVTKYTKEWGIQILHIDIKDMEIPANMKQSMAAQAQAEREARAKIILSEAEIKSSKLLKEAAKILANDEMGGRLRFYQMLKDVGNKGATTTILPFPTEMLNLFKNKNGVK